MATNGVFIGEEPFHKLLIHHSDFLRSCCVCVGDTAPADHGLAYSFEKLGAHAVPRSAIVRVRTGIGASFDEYLFAPVIPLQRAVERQSHTLYPGNSSEPLFQGLV